MDGEIRSLMRADFGFGGAMDVAFLFFFSDTSRIRTRRLLLVQRLQTKMIVFPLLRKEYATFWFVLSMAFFGYAGREAHVVWEGGVSSLCSLIQRMRVPIALPYLRMLGFPHLGA